MRDKAKLPKRMRDILAIAPNGRNAKQEQEVLTAYRNIDSVRHAVGGLGLGQNYLLAAHVQAMTMRTTLAQQLIALKAKIPAIPTTMVVQERKAPRATTIMLGGDFLRKGAAVQPNVPAVASRRSLQGEGRRRGDTAEFRRASTSPAGS